MTYKELVERKKIDELIENNDCLLFKAIVPLDNENKPMGMLEGNFDDSTSTIILIHFVEGMLNNLKAMFPYEARIAKEIDVEVKEGYRNFE